MDYIKYKNWLAHAEGSRSKYKGGFVNGKNTSAYNHDYYIHNKDKWGVKTGSSSGGHLTEGMEEYLNKQKEYDNSYDVYYLLASGKLLPMYGITDWDQLSEEQQQTYMDAVQEWSDKAIESGQAMQDDPNFDYNLYTGMKALQYMYNGTTGHEGIDYALSTAYKLPDPGSDKVSEKERKEWAEAHPKQEKSQELTDPDKIKDYKRKLANGTRRK